MPNKIRRDGNDHHPGCTRRDLLRAGAVALGALAMTDWTGAQSFAPSNFAKAKAVIQLWMDGGPAHLDTFDPKPDAGEDYTGPFRNPIGTNVAGVRIGELLPRLARHADKYAILRGMTHACTIHESARLLVQSDHVAGVDLNSATVAARAFELSQEKDDLRDRYGRNTFGESCLLARRLVEKGVPFVTVTDAGWDTHTNHSQTMRRKLPILDAGFATLLDDLAQRGLLDSTIVVWHGEFGRTPNLAVDATSNGGRHHYARAYCAVVAGGGFKGGRVVGATDRRGQRVVDRPVHPSELAASIQKLLGIAGADGKLPAGGLLHEIM